MKLFRRLFKIGQAEAHSAVDKLEDPIKLTEQGIRDLKEQLDKSLHALASVKAMAIRSRNESDDAKQKAEDYEQKAMIILQQAERGEMDTAEADRLAQEALIKKEANVKVAKESKARQDKFESDVDKLEKNVKQLKSQISKYENELKTLKARITVSKATKTLNKQLSEIDSTGTVSMLERMKEKVSEEEALAESYGEIANESRTIDDEIDKAIESASEAEASDSLAALKEKMGLKKSDEDKPST